MNEENCFPTNFSERLYLFLQQMAEQDSSAKTLLEEWDALAASGNYPSHCAFASPYHNRQSMGLFKGHFGFL